MTGFNNAMKLEDLSELLALLVFIRDNAGKIEFKAENIELNITFKNEPEETPDT